MTDYRIDRSKVYSWSNATPDLMGKKGYFGESVKSLKKAVEQGWIYSVLLVRNEDADSIDGVFMADNGKTYGLFLPLES